MTSGFQLTRRSALTGMAAASSLALSGCFGGSEKTAVENTPAAKSKARSLSAIGIQLYTLRDQMAEDFEGSLAKLAALGFAEVEFAGYFGKSATEVRNILAGAGLSSPSTHVDINDLRKDMDGLLDYCAEVGHDYVVVPWLAPEERTLDGYKKNIGFFANVGEAARERGLRFGYHNHEFEFDMVEGVRPYDLMLSELDASLMEFTMDLFWITKAGFDPLAYFDKYPGRFEICHVKDMTADGDMVDVGQGQIDFARIFAASEKAGLKHFHVEHDNPANGDGIASGANSIKHLKSLTF